MVLNRRGGPFLLALESIPRVPSKGSRPRATKALETRDSFRLRIKISPRRMNISPSVNRSRPGTHRFRRENLITKRRLGPGRARYRRGISKRFAGSCGERNFGGRQCAPILIVGNPSSKGWRKPKRKRHDYWGEVVEGDAACRRGATVGNLENSNFPLGIIDNLRIDKGSEQLRTSRSYATVRNYISVCGL